VRVVAAALAYLLSLAVIAAAAFIVVLVIAGPHAGLLPSWLEPVVLGLGWVAVRALPIRTARKVWRRFRKPAPPDNPIGRDRLRGRRP